MDYSRRPQGLRSQGWELRRGLGPGGGGGAGEGKVEAEARVSGGPCRSGSEAGQSLS